MVAFNFYEEYSHSFNKFSMVFETLIIIKHTYGASAYIYVLYNIHYTVKYSLYSV